MEVFYYQAAAIVLLRLPGGLIFGLTARDPGVHLDREIC